MGASRWAGGWDEGTEMRGPVSQGEKHQKLGKQLTEERKGRGGVWRHHDPLPEPRVECKLGQGPEGRMTHGCLFRPSPTSP